MIFFRALEEDANHKENPGLKYQCTACGMGCCRDTVECQLYFRLYQVSVLKDSSLHVLVNVVHTERMLHDVYTINLPMNSALNEQPRREDHVSTRILQLLHPILLTTKTPLSVVGDGNYLYRATSLALYGTEKKHYQLHLFAALEMLEHRNFYEEDDSQFIDSINDLRVVTATYQRLVGVWHWEICWNDVCVCLKCSCSLSLRSYYPPTSANEFLSEPLSRNRLMWCKANNSSCDTGVDTDHSAKRCTRFLP